MSGDGLERAQSRAQLYRTQKLEEQAETAYRRAKVLANEGLREALTGYSPSVSYSASLSALADLCAEAGHRVMGKRDFLLVMDRAYDLVVKRKGEPQAPEAQPALPPAAAHTEGPGDW